MKRYISQLRPTIGLFLLRNRVLIGALLLVGVVAYLGGGWWNVLIVYMLLLGFAAVGLGVALLFGWL